MGKYIKVFNNHNGYTAFTQTADFVKPNVSHCISENDVHYNPLPIWGAVDLGLSVKWASRNVGATSETDYGLYFQWGDTQGYSADQVGSGEGKKYFWWTDYKWSNGGTSNSKPKFTKYCPSGKTAGYYADGFTGDTLVTLESVDDAAFAASGGQYRMPTQAEFEELTANTTSAWDNEKSGYTFIAQNGNSIFFPAAGHCEQGEITVDGSWGYYKSSSLKSDDPIRAYNLYFGGNTLGVSYFGRDYGNNVRAVLNQ